MKLSHTIISAATIASVAALAPAGFAAGEAKNTTPFTLSATMQVAPQVRGEQKNALPFTRATQPTRVAPTGEAKNTAPFTRVVTPTHSTPWLLIGLIAALGILLTAAVGARMRSARLSRSPKASPAH